MIAARALFIVAAAGIDQNVVAARSNDVAMKRKDDLAVIGEMARWDRAADVGEHLIRHLGEKGLCVRHREIHFLDAAQLKISNLDPRHIHPLFGLV